ncbi:hypothetical protein [Streptomyces sp. NPDC096013]|uniref:hypothetical protein n=1 Tax=Streptomyces sp. NPDC096013 TaxID=3366069 RepID=UPI00380E0F57
MLPTTTRTAPVSRRAGAAAVPVRDAGSDQAGRPSRGAVGVFVDVVEQGEFRLICGGDHQQRDGGAGRVGTPAHAHTLIRWDADFA